MLHLFLIKFDFRNMPLKFVILTFLSLFVLGDAWAVEFTLKDGRVENIAAANDDIKVEGGHKKNASIVTSEFLLSQHEMTLDKSKERSLTVASQKAAPPEDPTSSQNGDLVKIKLKSGNIIEAKLLTQEEDYITIDFRGVQLTYDRQDIESIGDMDARETFLDLSVCDQEKNNVIARKDCLQRLALKHKEPEYCAEIERDPGQTSTLQVSCFGELAFAENDPEICRTLVDIKDESHKDQAKECYTYYAILKKDPTYCRYTSEPQKECLPRVDIVKNHPDLNINFAAFYGFTAISKITRDGDICQYERPKLRPQCEAGIERPRSSSEEAVPAPKSTSEPTKGSVANISACERPEVSDRTECIKKIAVDQGNPALCLAICPRASCMSSTMTNCLVEIALAKDDQGVCLQQRSDDENINSGTYCSMLFAIQKKDQALCPRVLRKHCYTFISIKEKHPNMPLSVVSGMPLSRLAIKLNDKSICEHEERQSDKAKCLQQFEQEYGPNGAQAGFDIMDLPPSLKDCEAMEGPERDRCVSEIAMTSQDASLCKFIWDGWVEHSCDVAARYKKNYSEDENSKHSEFAEHLEACTPYSYQYAHPFTGELMERKIEGIVDGKCLYREEMPGASWMECRYSEEFRKAVASQYRMSNQVKDATFKVEFGGKGVKSTTSVDGKELDVSATIDGKVIKNPLNYALQSGICVVIDQE